ARQSEVPPPATRWFRRRGSEATHSSSRGPTSSFRRSRCHRGSSPENRRTRAAKKRRKPVERGTARTQFDKLQRRIDSVTPLGSHSTAIAWKPGGSRGSSLLEGVALVMKEEPGSRA